MHNSFPLVCSVSDILIEVIALDLVTCFYYIISETSAVVLSDVVLIGSIVDNFHLTPQTEALKEQSNTMQ